MTDLHDTKDWDRNIKIDAAGWLFAAFVMVLVGAAAVVGYEGNSASVTGSNVAQLPRSPR